MYSFRFHTLQFKSIQYPLKRKLYIQSNIHDKSNFPFNSIFPFDVWHHIRFMAWPGHAYAPVKWRECNEEKAIYNRKSQPFFSILIRMEYEEWAYCILRCIPLNRRTFMVDITLNVPSQATFGQHILKSQSDFAEMTEPQNKLHYSGRNVFPLG